ncbi:coiled-coil domain-containing protein 185 [Erinaceus europaeus]|uniref:Coiled-coil domain-containing protein 185 n=1 Tax=Erinaceus europaeus TaxID=9365 RepID=A0ABM3XI70_ERIEU|nr:coiled-coil domain-containing protein 185 [Erinaceus europaeus]
MEGSGHRSSRRSSWAPSPAPPPRPRRRRPRPASPRESRSLGDLARRPRPRAAWSEAAPPEGCGHCARCRPPRAPDGDRWAEPAGPGSGSPPSAGSGPRRPRSAPGEPGGEARRRQLQSGLREALASARGQELVALVLSRLQKAQRMRELQRQAAAAWDDLQRSDRRVRRTLERERRLLLQQSREHWQLLEPRRAHGGPRAGRETPPEERAREPAEPGRRRWPEPERPPARGEPPCPGKAGLSSLVNYEARRVLRDCQAKAEELLRRLALEQPAGEAPPLAPGAERPPEGRRRAPRAEPGAHRGPRDKALQLRQPGLLREQVLEQVRERQSHVAGIKEALRRREREEAPRDRARDPGRAAPTPTTPSSGSLDALLLEARRRAGLQRGRY